MRTFISPWLSTLRELVKGVLGQMLEFCFFGLFAFSRAAPVAHGGSQARGLIGVVATGLCNEGSEPRL